MKAACNNIFISIYSKGHNGFLGKTDSFQPKKKENYWMRTLKTLTPLGLNFESVVKHFIYIFIDKCFCTTILDWTVLGPRTSDTIVILYLF